MAGKEKPLILIVEDDPRLIDAYRENLCEETEVLVATTLAEARDVFAKHKERIRLITLDGTLMIRYPRGLEDRDEGTEVFLKEIRPVFNRPIIAASGHPDMRALLLHHGCDVAVESKRKLPEKILEILRLP
jgi:DNA-binding response OmpR family regulator